MRLIAFCICLIGSAPALAADLSAQTPTDAVTVVSEELSYQLNNNTFTGFIAWDAAKQGPRPGIVVVHEWWGHNDYVRRRALQLAELGYTAIAIDMYGNGKLAEHPNDAKKFMMQALKNMPRAKRRFMAGYARLKKHPTVDPTRIAAIGYCFGGGVVLHMARMGVDLRGVVSFHGSLGTETPAKPGDIQGHVLVLTGDADPMAPTKQVRAFQDEMTAARATFEVISYPGARHAFTVPEATEKGLIHGLPLAYNRTYDDHSWAEMQRFLDGVFSEAE